MLALKGDHFVDQPLILMSHWIARTVQQQMPRLAFAHFFTPTTVLVPVPSSSLMRPGTLWAPDRIAKALVANAIGREVVECLARVKPLRKAAMSDASSRPKPAEQYETISVQGAISEPKPNEIVLVDDIITRGATFLGAANRLVEAFPGARIRCFAAMRTISDPSEFKSLYDPVLGSIRYREETGDTLRRP